MKRLRRLLCCGSACSKKDKRISIVPEQAHKPPTDGNLKDKNDSKARPAYSNEAYENHEHHSPLSSTTPKIENAKDEKILSYEKHHKISDVSVLFRPPSPDKKDISDIVIEKFDRKSRKLRSQRMSHIDKEEIDDEIESTIDSDDENKDHIDTLLEDETFFNAKKNEERNAEQIDDLTNNELPNDDFVVIDGFDKKGDDTQQPNRSTEWRDKLKLALMEDDDEEFLDESTSSEEEDDRKEVDETMKTNSIKPATSPGSASTKILSERAVVIDNGSYTVRGGWAGDFAPETCIRNVVGSWRSDASEVWQETLGSKFIGEAALQKHSTLALGYPVEDGKIKSYRGVQDVIEHIVIKELEADSREHPIVITEAVSVEKRQREKLLETLIERLGSPGVCLKSQAAMCALASGQKVVLVINSGYGSTELVPVYYGYTLPYAATTLGVGGRHVTEYLTRLTQREHGITFSSFGEMEVINSIKEKFAKVAISNQDEQQISTSELKEYELPDGKTIQLGDVLNKCTDPLFSPGLVGNGSVGIPLLVKQTLDRIDADFMQESENYILFSGGNSNISGFKEKLELEISANMNGLQPALKRSVAGDNSAWVGASIVAEQSDFSNLCVNQDMYFEYGANVIHRICF